MTIEQICLSMKKSLWSLKVAPEYQSQDEPKLLNELKATRAEVGLLINLDREEVEFKRFVY